MKRIQYNRRHTRFFALSVLVFLWAGGCVDPSNIYVDSTATGPGCGSEDHPLRSIQLGLSLVAEGGTVHVAAGDYLENLVVRKPVRLLGAGTGETRLLAEMTRKGIEVRSGDVEIAGFSIIGQGEPDRDNLFVGGIWVEDVDRITLRDNEVGPYWMMGIGVGKVTGVRIENNRAFQITGFDYGESFGFLVALTEDLELKENLAFDVMEGVGIYVDECVGVVEGNTSTSNMAGMFIRTDPDRDPDLSVLSNHTDANLEMGLVLHRAVISAFFDNTILNNGGAGVMDMDYLSYLPCEIAGGGPECEDLLITDMLECGNNLIGGNNPDFEYPVSFPECFVSGGSV